METEGESPRIVRLLPLIGHSATTYLLTYDFSCHFVAKNTVSSLDKYKMTLSMYWLFPLPTKLTFPYLTILTTLRKHSKMCICYKIKVS